MAKTPKPLNKRTDIIVIVPKQDELFWIGVAFGFEFGKPDRRRCEPAPRTCRARRLVAGS